VSRERRYLEVGDFLLIAAAVTGILANVLAESDRIVSQAIQHYMCLSRASERSRTYSWPLLLIR